MRWRLDEEAFGLQPGRRRLHRALVAEGLAEAGNEVGEAGPLRTPPQALRAVPGGAVLGRRRHLDRGAGGGPAVQPFEKDGMGRHGLRDLGRAGPDPREKPLDLASVADIDRSEGPARQEVGAREQEVVVALAEDGVGLRLDMAGQLVEVEAIGEALGNGGGAGGGPERLGTAAEDVMRGDRLLGVVVETVHPRGVGAAQNLGRPPSPRQVGDERFESGEDEVEAEAHQRLDRAGRGAHGDDVALPRGAAPAAAELRIADAAGAVLAAGGGPQEGLRRLRRRGAAVVDEGVIGASGERQRGDPALRTAAIEGEGGGLRLARRRQIGDAVPGAALGDPRFTEGRADELRRRPGAVEEDVALDPLPPVEEEGGDVAVGVALDPPDAARDGADALGQRDLAEDADEPGAVEVVAVIARLDQRGGARLRAGSAPLRRHQGLGCVVGVVARLPAGAALAQLQPVMEQVASGDPRPAGPERVPMPPPPREPILEAAGEPVGAGAAAQEDRLVDVEALPEAGEGRAGRQRHGRARRRFGGDQRHAPARPAQDPAQIGGGDRAGGSAASDDEARRHGAFGPEHRTRAPRPHTPSASGRP